jgi:hypothetical protein
MSPLQYNIHCWPSNLFTANKLTSINVKSTLCCVLMLGSSRTARQGISPLPSGSKNKPSKKPTETGSIFHCHWCEKHKANKILLWILICCWKNNPSTHIILLRVINYFSLYFLKHSHIENSNDLQVFVISMGIPSDIYYSYFCTIEPLKSLSAELQYRAVR